MPKQSLRKPVPSSPKKNDDTIKVSFITSNDFDLNLDTIERNFIGTPELTTLCNDDVGTCKVGSPIR